MLDHTIAGQEANTPVSDNMTRRTVVTAIPATCASLALAGAVNAQAGETEIMTLFRRYQALLGASATHVTQAKGKAEDEELERLYYGRMRRIETQLQALPSLTIQDFAAKLMAATEGGVFGLPDDHPIWREARQLLGVSARLTSGFEGVA